MSFLFTFAVILYICFLILSIDYMMEKQKIQREIQREKNESNSSTFKFDILTPTIRPLPKDDEVDHVKLFKSSDKFNEIIENVLSDCLDIKNTFNVRKSFVLNSDFDIIDRYQSGSTKISDYKTVLTNYSNNVTFSDELFEKIKNRKFTINGSNINDRYFSLDVKFE